MICFVVVMLMYDFHLIRQIVLDKTLESWRVVVGCCLFRVAAACSGAVGLAILAFERQVGGRGERDEFGALVVVELFVIVVIVFAAAASATVEFDRARLSEVAAPFDQCEHPGQDEAKFFAEIFVEPRIQKRIVDCARPYK